MHLHYAIERRQHGVAPDRSLARIATDQTSNASLDDIKLRTFDETTLSKESGEGLRWLKLIGFAAALRDQQNVPAALPLIELLRKKGNGRVAEIANEMRGYDLSIVWGLFARTAILGNIVVDLGKFRFATPLAGNG